jgi:RNAse (barnase) inhibitor barstar
VSKHRYIIDGQKFSTLEEFAKHFSSVVLNGRAWNGNLDAFNDILGGGFGTPDEGFIIEWRNHELSKQCLGHAETARRFEQLLKTCHPSNIPRIKAELAAARRGVGPTLFDTLVAIIGEHAVGGAEAEDGVDLILT